MKFIKDFKEFAVKGNLLDMAIGIIIGTAFGNVVSSLVKDMIMPIFGFVLADTDFTKLQYILRGAELDVAGNIVREAVIIYYGNFLQRALDFLIISLSIFGVVRLINSLKRKAEDPSDSQVPTPQDIQLLSEIRDLLKKQN